MVCTDAVPNRIAAIVTIYNVDLVTNHYRTLWLLHAFPWLFCVCGESELLPNLKFNLGYFDKNQKLWINFSQDLSDALSIVCAAVPDIVVCVKLSLKS